MWLSPAVHVLVTGGRFSRTLLGYFGRNKKYTKAQTTLLVNATHVYISVL